MRPQGESPYIVTFVVPSPLEQGEPPWVINCDCALVEVYRTFIITDVSESHQIMIEIRHNVDRLGKI